MAEPLASLGPDVAPAVEWFAEPHRVGALVAELASCTTRHEDAHLAKYVLACIEAASADPERERLFLASTARLVGVWGADGSLS